MVMAKCWLGPHPSRAGNSWAYLARSFESAPSFVGASFNGRTAALHAADAGSTPAASTTFCP